MPNCLLVATLGKSPGIVTTCIDCLADRGKTVTRLLAIAMPEDNTPAEPGGAAFRRNVDVSRPRVLNPVVRALKGTATVVDWYVLNLDSGDLMTEADNLAYYLGCLDVIERADELMCGGDFGTSWLCLAGGRKSMSALAYSAGIAAGSGLSPCHVTVSKRIEDLAAQEPGRNEVLHPPGDERAFMELPRLTGSLTPLSSDARSKLRGATSFGELNRTYDDIVGRD